MAKFLETLKKPSILTILRQFCPFLGKNEFSPKVRLSQLLDFTIIYHHAKQQKINEQLLRKTFI